MTLPLMPKWLSSAFNPMPATTATTAITTRGATATVVTAVPTTAAAP